MDLKTIISEPLWAAVETMYESRNYTGAILDAVYYLGDFIREKTGLQSDGVALVMQAFGGKSPKLKVNRLQTESDRNVQKGTESLLLGLYQGIRNPRSHGKHVDTKEDAETIILFVNYLLNIIGASKGTFSKNEFMDRIFDPAFVNKKRYAELLVNEIPPRQRLDIMIEVYRRKEEGESNKLTLFTHTLLEKLEDDEISRLAEVVSMELKSTNDESSVRLSVAIFPIQFWLRLDEAARLRCENMLLTSIKEGEYLTASQKCIKGALGTWSREFISYSQIKDDFIWALLTKLESTKKTEQDYVFEYFGYRLLSILTNMKDTYLAEWAVDIINRNLIAGDKRFYDMVGLVIEREGFWKDSLKAAFDGFQEVKSLPSKKSKEDIPF